MTGGAVYRGTAQPALAGWYVFADYCSGRMWLLDAEPVEPGPRRRRPSRPYDPTARSAPSPPDRTGSCT